MNYASNPKPIWDKSHWENREPGLYVAKDEYGVLLMVNWTGVAPGSSMPVDDKWIVKDYEEISYKTINDMYVELINMANDLANIKADIRTQSLIKPQSSGIDGDTLIRALAVAQKPELAKDI